jgi:WD40 repeat protein
MSDVFISYSRKDSAFVHRLFTALEAQGHNAWVDWEDIEYAEDWWRKIQTSIEGAHHFVFIMSPHSARSKVCFDEVQHAETNHKRIIPVVIEDVSDPADRERLHPAIKRQNWLLFRREDDFDMTFASLLETIRREPAHVRMHTRLLVNAHEWTLDKRNNSLLLRGENLRRAEQWLAQAEGKSPIPAPIHTAYVAASREAERDRRRQLAGIAALSLAVIGVLGLAALALFRQTQYDAEVQASLGLAEEARSAFDGGDIFRALALGVEANQMTDPPAESRSTLREIASAPGPVALFISDNPITSVAFSPDHAHIAAGYADGSLRLWDAAGGVGRYETPLFTADIRHTESVNSLDFDPRGRYVASAGCAARDAENTEPDNTCIKPEVFLWEVVENELILRQRFTNDEDYFGLRGEAYDVDLFSTGDLELAVASGDAEGPITFRYSPADSGAIEPPFVSNWRTGNTHTRDVITAVAHSIDDEIVSGDIEGQLHYFQGSNTPAEALPSPFVGRVLDIAYSPDPAYDKGNRPFLAASTDGTLLLASRSRILNTFTFGSPVNGVSYNPDGALALAAVDDGRLALMDARAMRIAFTLRWQAEVAFADVDFGTLPIYEPSPTPGYAITGSADGTIILWDTTQADLDADDAAALLAWLSANRYVEPRSDT